MSRLTDILRWMARITGLLLAMLVGLVLTGEGFDPGQLNVGTAAMTVAFLGAVAGTLLLWRWEVAGGLLVLLGMASFYGINFLMAGNWPGGWVLPLCFLPGILAVLSSAVTAMCESRDQGSSGLAG